MRDISLSVCPTMMLVLRTSVVDTRGCLRSPSDATVLGDGVRRFVPNLFVTSSSVLGVLKTVKRYLQLGSGLVLVLKLGAN